MVTFGSKPRSSLKKPSAAYRRRRPQKIKRFQSVNGVLNQSTCVVKRRPTPQVLAMERIGMPNIKLGSLAQTFLVDPGLQYNLSISHMSQQQLASIRQLVPPQAAPLASRYVLESWQSEMVFTNTTSASVEMEFYDICLKRDTFAGNYTTNTTVPVTYPINIGSPSEYWRAGALMNANLADTTTQPLTPSNFMGSSPFDSQLFRDYFKVLKRTRVLLTQGGSHRHFVIFHPNACIDDSLINNVNKPGLQGLSMWTLVVAKGLPQTLGTGASVPPAVTLSLAQLAVAISYRAKYTWVQDNSNSLFAGTSLAQPTNTAVFNIGSGAVTTAVTATI